MKLKYILLIVLGLVIFSGCGQSLLTSFKKTTKIAQATKTDGAAKLEGHVNIDYPAPTTVTVTASGNSNPQINVGSTGHVKATKDKKESASLKRDDKFSIDEFIESVPTWLWPIIIFGFIGLIGIYIIWTKTTATGRASDSFIAGRIKSINKITDKIGDMLDNAAPDSDAHKMLKDLKEYSRQEQSNQHKKSR